MPSLKIQCVLETHKTLFVLICEMDLVSRLSYKLDFFYLHVCLGRYRNISFISLRKLDPKVFLV